VNLTRRAFLGGGAALCISAIARGQVTARTLTATDVHVSDYPTVQALRWIGQMLTQETGGRIGLRVYHSGQLGREGDAINMVRFGALDITRVNMAVLNNPFPLTQILSLPYVFQDEAHMRRALDGAPGQEIARGFERRDLVCLAYYDSGMRHLYNTRHAVTAPRDLHGLKIRVPPSDIFMQLLRRFEANATPLPYGEVFSALQTHLIDGAENNWQTFHTTRQFEVAKFIARTGHSFSPEALLMSRRTLDALPAPDRGLLLDIAQRSVPYMRSLWDKAEAASREYVLGKGVRESEVDIAAFRAAAAPLLAAYRRDPQLDALYTSIQSLA
jgi:tripartite ATP-independent transporter DctP family solute receptor